MSRGKIKALSKQDGSLNQSIENFAVHHIVAVRTVRGGEISAVKHVTYGWLKPIEYYELQKTHELAEMAIPIISAGYTMKGYIMSSTVNLDFLASGFSVPFGVIEVMGAFTLYAADLASGNQLLQTLDLLALFLPFGELYYLFRAYDIFYYWYEGEQTRPDLINDLRTGHFIPTVTDKTIEDALNWLKQNLGGGRLRGLF